MLGTYAGRFSENTGYMSTCFFAQLVQISNTLAYDIYSSLFEIGLDVVYSVLSFSLTQTLLTPHMQGSDPHMEGSGPSNPYCFERPRAVWSVWVLPVLDDLQRRLPT